jgi:hypothetical protein
VFLAFEVVIIYLYFVETRYTPIEEIAKYFDKDHVEVAELTLQQREKELAEEGKGGVVSEVEVEGEGEGRRA